MRAILLLLGCCASFALGAQPDKAALRALLAAERFAELDRQLSAAQADYREGRINDEEAFRPFTALTVVDSERRPLYDRWVAELPNSYAARLARGFYLSGLGWAARGQAYASETPEHRFADMRGYFRDAMADLEASLALDPKPVLSFATMIRVARGDSSFGNIGSLLTEATALDKHAYNARMSYLLGIRPEWGGSLERMAVIVEDARANLTPPQVARFERVLDASRSREELSGADALFQSGQIAAAIERYSAELQKRATGRGFASRGWAHLRVKQHQNAIADFTRSLEVDPDEYCGCNSYAGRAEAWLGLGQRMKAMPDLIHAAEEQDNHWAARELAGIYAYGWHGAIPDPHSARPWCERAARQGDPWSMHCIAHAYRTGWGGAKPDLAKGLQWMQRSAERNVPGAQYDLGWIYWLGGDVPVDRPRAVYWWGRAALQGDTLAQGRLLELIALPLFTLVGLILAICAWILFNRRRRKNV